MVQNTRANSKSTLHDADKKWETMQLNGRRTVRNEYRKFRSGMYHYMILIISRLTLTAYNFFQDLQNVHVLLHDVIVAKITVLPYLLKLFSQIHCAVIQD